MAMYWGNTVVSSSGSKDCVAMVQSKLYPTVNQEFALFGQLGKAMTTPGWAKLTDLTDSYKPKLGYYSVTLLNPDDDGSHGVDGTLELADRNGSPNTICTFGSTTNQGVGLKQDNLL